MGTSDLAKADFLVERRRALAIVALLWCVMTLWNFGLPGLQFDEVNHYAFIPGLKSEQAAERSHFRLPDNYLDEADGLRRYPIVGGSVYNSVVGAYLGLPYFLVAGHSQATVRLFTALVALASILAITILVGRLFGWTAAAVAGAIIATDPSHVFSARSQGASIWPVILFWALSAHFLLNSVRNKGSSVWSAVCAGACLGISSMAYFIGLFLALPVVAAALIIHRRNPRWLMLFIGSGLVAYSPFVYALFSIQLSQPELLKNFGVPDWAQRESMALFSQDNLMRLNRLVIGSFASHDFAGGITGRFSTEGSWFRLPAFLAAFTIGSLMAFNRKALSGEQRAFFWVAGLILFLYLSAMFLLKATSFHHLLPLTMIVAAAAASTLYSRGLMRPLALTISAFLLISNLTSLRNAHDRLLETGGRGFHNENHTLVAELLSGPLMDYHPVFAGWGFHLQFLLLTDGHTPYTFLWSPEVARIDSLLRQHGQVAVVVPHAEYSSVGQTFRSSKKLIFQQRDGVDLFQIYLLEAESERLN